MSIHIHARIYDNEGRQFVFEPYSPGKIEMRIVVPYVEESTYYLDAEELAEAVNAIVEHMHKRQNDE